MKHTIRLAREIRVPLDVVTQTLGAIGRKGSGKTYLATMLAEQMLDAGAQVVAIDPVGVWWGLRVGADGRSKGKEIFVIGGDHGDVPLVPEAGARIARLIVDRNVCVVLDVSGFRLGERKRFCADLGEELLHLKKGKRSPVHLFIEEAQLLIPQRVGPEEARMVGAFEQIVRLGRNYGIGCTLISQRPQSVNKEVLSQVECLCVLQVTGSHERKALEEWVQEVGADRKLVGELPGLAQGEGFVWSPSWLRTYERVHFSPKTTFDASATPEVGKATRAASLSAVDVEALRRDLAEVVKQVEADDPKVLRRRIAELERGRPPAVAPAKTTVVEVPVVKPTEVARLEKLVEKLLTAQDRLAQAQQVIVTEVGNLRTAIAGVTSRRSSAVALQRYVAADVRETRAVERVAEQFSGKLPRGLRAVLTAIAQHREGCTREQITVLTGYKRSSRDTYLQRLREQQLIESRGDRLMATSMGVDALGPAFEPLPTGDALRRHWLVRLPMGEKALFSRLVEAYPRAVDVGQLSDETGYKRSSRDTYLQRLKARQLILSEGRGCVRASDTLFGEQQ